MAVTTTVTESLGSIGNNHGFLLSITTSGNYATGGYAIAPTGVEHIQLLIPEQVDGLIWRFDEPTQKLLAYNPTAAHTHTETGTTTAANAVAAGSEFANGAALAKTVQAFALGE